MRGPGGKGAPKRQALRQTAFSAGRTPCGIQHVVAQRCQRSGVGNDDVDVAARGTQSLGFVAQVAADRVVIAPAQRGKYNDMARTHGQIGVRQGADATIHIELAADGNGGPCTRHCAAGGDGIHEIGTAGGVEQAVFPRRRIHRDHTEPALRPLGPRQTGGDDGAPLFRRYGGAAQREGANASVLRRNWLGSRDLYVPEPIWTHTAERVLTLERVRGIPSDDIAALDAAGIDRKALAAKGVRVFYTQVFRDNFFHADAHAGNIWVDPERRDNPRFIALDFGIMGQLSREDQYYLAENFMAIFRQDYRRIAELHIQAGWMPAHLRIDELEAAVRSVCEPYFTRPLSEISLGEVLGKLFRTAQRYQLTLQPQLILLQKTLLSIEGIGRLLDPRLDIWAVARPVLERILVERYSPQRLGREFRDRLPELITQAPDMPRLLHGWLKQQVEGRHELRMRSDDLAALTATMQGMQKRVVAAILGVGLLIVAAVLYALEAGGPTLLGLPVATWVAGVGGLWALLAAWPRR